MATLQNQKLKDTYKEVLKLDVSRTSPPAGGNGVGATLVAVEDGAGTDTALQLSTTQIASGVDGSAATPAITRSSDTDTGIFFPSSNAIAVSTQGTEAMRIDSSGRVGIGATSLLTNTPLTVGNGSAATRRILTVNGGANSGTGALVNLQLGGTDVGALTTSNWASSDTSSDLSLYAYSGKAIRFHPNGTEAMRIDSSGRVGIGTTSPASRLDVVGNVTINALSNGVTAFNLRDNVGTATNQYFDVDLAKGGGAYNYMRFRFNNEDVITWGGSLSAYANILRLHSHTGSIRLDTSNTERLRIDSSGRVGIGTNSPVNRLQIVGSFGRGAPVTKTADFTLADTENWVINNKSGSSCTVTLPAASSWTGREFTIKTIQAQTVVSASSSGGQGVVPRDGSTAGTAILANTAGNWATLVSDGTNWVIMAGS